jgi:hypothetical protein
MRQGNSTVQELYNQMSKLVERMVHPPDAYTIRRWFLEALQPSISTKVLELGYNAKQHLLQQLYTTAKQLEEAKLYTMVYNKAAAISSDQPQALQTAQSNQVPAEVARNRLAGILLAKTNLSTGRLLKQ